ncbi:hypothetical protein LWI29_009029 [Acer saccharum]|uniref:Uncharacterized protein n=1 Tax=Acer saccharum TaxID=4024 RepID=A0AA39RV92_ACESA|nr:hypothetical protein LWI29_009029 [Acer saccharum]
MQSMEIQPSMETVGLAGELGVGEALTGDSVDERGGGARAKERDSEFCDGESLRKRSTKVSESGARKSPKVEHESLRKRSTKVSERGARKSPKVEHESLQKRSTKVSELERETKLIEAPPNERVTHSEYYLPDNICGQAGQLLWIDYSLKVNQTTEAIIRGRN